MLCLAINMHSQNIADSQIKTIKKNAKRAYVKSSCSKGHDIKLVPIVYSEKINLDSSKVCSEEFLDLFKPIVKKNGIRKRLKADCLVISQGSLVGHYYQDLMYCKEWYKPNSMLRNEEILAKAVSDLNIVLAIQFYEFPLQEIFLIDKNKNVYVFNYLNYKTYKVKNYFKTPPDRRSNK